MKFASRFGALLLACLPAAALAQGIMPDVIGATVGNMSAGWPERCLSLREPEKPQSVARFEREAEPALRAYLTLAGSGADPAPAYKRSWTDQWSLDATSKDLRAVRDPWADRVERLEKVGLILGRGEIFGHGIWRAYDREGALLGTYEAELIRKTKGYAIGRISLWSPGQESRAKPLAPYCASPGDHEEWAEAKAKAEARRAQRRAAREGQRSGTSR